MTKEEIYVIKGIILTTPMYLKEILQNENNSMWTFEKTNAIKFEDISKAEVDLNKLKAIDKEHFFEDAYEIIEVD